MEGVKKRNPRAKKMMMNESLHQSHFYVVNSIYIRRFLLFKGREKALLSSLQFAGAKMGKCLSFSSGPLGFCMPLNNTISYK